MKKLYYIFVLLLFASVVEAQLHKTDTIVDMGIYKSYFCYALKEPLYVTYRLYKGGGDCDRGKEHFSFGKCGIATANHSDYSGSHLDKGHLANAEDFAGDCEAEEKTFCYYNCVPQTVKLNRGVWKSWEEKVRKLSQGKALFIVAGSIFGKKTIGENRIGVPDYCYKIVLDASTKKILYCVLFENDDSRRFRELSLGELKGMLGYDLVP